MKTTISQNFYFAKLHYFLLNNILREINCSELGTSRNWNLKAYLTFIIISTLWKIKLFSASQILREINFGRLKVLKSAILTLFKPLNFDFGQFQTWKYQIITTISMSRILRMISRKIWMAEKILKCPHCVTQGINSPILNFRASRIHMWQFSFKIL